MPSIPAEVRVISRAGALRVLGLVLILAAILPLIPAVAIVKGSAWTCVVAIALLQIMARHLGAILIADVVRRAVVAASSGPRSAVTATCVVTIVAIAISTPSIHALVAGFKPGPVPVLISPLKQFR